MLTASIWIRHCALGGRASTTKRSKPWRKFHVIKALELADEMSILPVAQVIPVSEKHAMQMRKRETWVVMHHLLRRAFSLNQFVLPFSLALSCYPPCSFAALVGGGRGRARGTASRGTLTTAALDAQIPRQSQAASRTVSASP